MRVLFSICTLIFSALLFGQTTVNFNLSGIQDSGYKNVGIRGNGGSLSWDKSAKMKKTDNVYTLSLEFDKNISEIEFKYVLYNSNKDVKWESISNRKLDLNTAGKLNLEHNWDEEPPVDISKLSKISSSRLSEEYQIIEKLILDVHPGTYRYNSKEDIENALNDLKKSFSKDLSYQEAYLAISMLLAKIQCDHTFASFYNQDKLLKQIIHEQKDKLPFTFLWLEGEMVVIKDASEANLPRGTKILTINDKPTKDILSELLPYVRADGATDKSRIRQLEIDAFPYRYNAFDVFHPLFYKINSEIKLELQKPNNESEVIYIKSMTRDQRAKLLNQRFRDFEYDKSELWGFEVLENNIGYLKAGTFDDSGMNRDWRKYFSKLFSDINKKNIKNLIVDLRYNQGGFDEIGNGLITHLIKEKGVINDYVSKSRYKVFPESLKPYVSSWGEPWYYNLEVENSNPENGYFTLEEDIEFTKPAKNAFKGNVYFLVGPSNVSMAYYLATAIKKYKIGTLVGEETGGNQKGINGGQILFMRLPNTKIEIDFPVDGTFSKDINAKNRGVIPDYIVQSSLNEIISGKDAPLEKAIQLIKSN